MPYRFYFYFACITACMLFYPGNSRYFTIFANNADLFNQQVVEEVPEIKPIPVLRNQSAPFVSAQGVYIADLQSFTPVYSKNANQQMYPASTTKVVTALVAYDLYEMDEVVTIGRVLNEGQIMGLVPNERITVENLLYGALVHSGNDAAQALADHYGYEEFMEKMNEKAASLGMRNSQFDNPTGLDDLQQLSSPFDLAVAGRELLRNPLLKKMVSTKQITVSDEDYRIFHPLSNVNQLLGEIQGLGGLKTGFTELAGQNLISYYRRPDGKEFIVVVMNSEDRFEDTRQIVSWINTTVDYIDPEL